MNEQKDKLVNEKTNDGLSGKKSYKKNNKKRAGRGTSREGGKYPQSNNATDYRNNQCNDPSWYIPTDQTLKDVASFNFNHPAGYKNATHKRYSSLAGGVYYDNDRTRTVPGIASLQLMPTIGTSSDETSAVNIAAMNMYSAIRRANSGAKNYDAPDLMSVVLAVGQVYSFIAWLFRLYGYTNVYSSQNAYIPRALVEANGVNWASLANSQNDFRARINQLVLQVNAINVPKSLPIFDRWFHIYEKCYADSSTPQAQIYQAVPRGFLHRRDETGALGYTELPYYQDGRLMEFEELIVYGTDMINSILYSEDVGTISGDVLKAFGDGGVYRMPIIPEDYSVVPTLSDEIRSQFENAVILPYYNEQTSYSITQDVDKAFLISNLKFVMPTNYVAPALDKALNFHTADITPADVIVASRWIPGIEGSTYTEAGNYVSVSFRSYGSELAVGLVITTTAVTPDGKITFSSTNVGSGMNATHVQSGAAPSAESYVVGVCSQISAFDWFPEIDWFVENRVAGNDSYDDSVYYMGTILDWDRYYILSSANIDDLNTTAILGLFGVPNL